MALVLSEEEDLLRRSAARLLDRRAPPAAFRALRDAGRGFDPAVWAEIAEAGFAGLLAPEACGGAGLGCAAAGLVAEEMGRTLAASPWFASGVLAAAVLTPLQGAAARRLLTAIAGGEVVATLALDEQPRHAPDGIATELTSAAGGLRLRGRKTAVLEAQTAQALVVAATRDGALALVVVGADRPGLTISPLRLIDSRNIAEVGFDGVPVAASEVVAEGAAAEAALARALDVGRAVQAAELLGLAQEAFARTVEHLKQREQFGRRIGEFQALRHRAAEVYCELELGRAVVLKALRALDDGGAEASALAGLAKAKLAAVARLALNEAVQMHGGVGVTDDLDIGLFLKRARVVTELLGDGRFQAERLAGLVWRL
jgi:acyl-CoA dehydrogenase